MKKLTITSLLLIGSATLAVAQATNSCNLIPNPSFEQQNVAQPSGNPNNIAGMYSQYDEVTGWQCINNYYGPSSPYYGRPTYYATNAPVGSATNPLTSPATNVGGSPFQPYNYNPSLNNGALSIIAAEIGNSSPINQPQYISPISPLTLTPGATYYASFQAYRSPAANSAVRLGMNLSQSSPQGPVSATTTSIQTPAPVTNSAWTRVSGKITIPQSSSSGPWYVTIGNITPNGPGAAARYYIDEVELYQIATAGSNNSVCIGTSVTIGSGCPIPGATYTWSAPGVTGLPTNSSTIQITVSPAATTTYTLTTNLPDATSASSQVTITVSNGYAPTAYQYDQQGDNCVNTAHFRVSNYDPSVTYTSTRGQGNPTVLAVDNTGAFIVKISGYQGSAVAYFTLTATSSCGGTATSDPIEADYNCDEARSPQTSAKTAAYPNPAAESIALPESAESATLLNENGKTVGKADKSGRLNVQSLPDGLYNLQMMQDGKLINQRIQVKH